VYQDFDEAAAEIELEVAPFAIGPHHNMPTSSFAGLRLNRELEFGFERAAHELEGPEPFLTRVTPSSTVATVLRLIRSRFAGLHRRAMRAASRTAALEWLGEALHLLQDSFSSAHVERAGGTGRIRHIRAFYIRFGWPPLPRAPREHRAPSDPRDDVYLRGALRPEARAAVRASRDFLTMALRHLRAPRSPRNAPELRAFMSRYLAM
jgi:hypothetical protein